MKKYFKYIMLIILIIIAILLVLLFTKKIKIGSKDKKTNNIVDFDIKGRNKEKGPNKKTVKEEYNMSEEDAINLVKEKYNNKEVDYKYKADVNYLSKYIVKVSSEELESDSFWEVDPETKSVKYLDKDDLKEMEKEK